MLLQAFKTGKYKKSYDIWSIGCCMVRILTKQEPWSNKFKSTAIINTHLINGTKFDNTIDNNLDFPIPEKIIEDYRDFYELVKGCLQNEIHSRITTDQILNELDQIEKKYIDQLNIIDV